MVQQIIYRCAISWRIRGKLGFQKMADLSARSYMAAVPFTYSGTDMSGLISARQRWPKLKCYDNLFTCLSSFFVHFDFTIIIETDSFTMALHKWQEEIQFENRTNRTKQITKQTLLVPILNYRKHWMRWIMVKSRPSFEKITLI